MAGLVLFTALANAAQAALARRESVWARERSLYFDFLVYGLVIIASGGAESPWFWLHDVLDFSKLEAGHMTFERRPVELSRCIEASIAIVRPKLEDRPVRLHAELAPDLPRWVLGDEIRLRQVLLNLVGNAIEFTSEGEVRVRAERVGTERFAIEVEDTGIPPASATSMSRPARAEGTI